jgi:hypothetical protein
VRHRRRRRRHVYLYLTLGLVLVLVWVMVLVRVGPLVPGGRLAWRRAGGEEAEDGREWCVSLECLAVVWSCVIWYELWNEVLSPGAGGELRILV